VSECSIGDRLPAIPRTSGQRQFLAHFALRLAIDRLPPPIVQRDLRAPKRFASR
jgi:hypothetical protein